MFYGVVGRKLRDVPFIGPYIAGMISVMPYMVSLIPVIRLSEAEPLAAPFTDVELFTISICTFLFGAAIGYFFIRRGALD